MKYSILIILWMSVVANATLTSRSTQDWWRGNVRITDAKVRVTIHDEYLDIEEEVLMEATALGNESTQNLNLLEINGILRTPKDIAITGILLWNGAEILKGKLKPNFEAA